MKNKSIIEDLQHSLFVEQLSFNIDLLNYKLSKLEQVNPMERENQFEYLVSLRKLPSKNSLYPFFVLMAGGKYYLFICGNAENFSLVKYM